MTFFDYFVEYAPLFIEASWVTLRLTAVALVIAMVLGGVIAWMVMSRFGPLRWLGTAYIGLIRGTPLIAQIFVLYFGISEIVKMPAFWAGALALAEITVCGKPSLLVPSPNVTNDHQYHNAKALSDAGAAIVVKEEELESNESVLAYSVLKLMHNKEKLNAMSLAAVRLGKADAADIIYDNLELDTLRSE